MLVLYKGAVRLSIQDWDAFRKALDAPPRRIPSLKKLLNNQGVTIPLILNSRVDR